MKIACEILVHNEIRANVTEMVEYILNDCVEDENAPFGYDGILNEYDYPEGATNDQMDDAQPKEVFEWYKVSSWLMEKLNHNKEVVIPHMNLWGRTTFGQMISQDYVIEKIVKDLHEVK